MPQKPFKEYRVWWIPKVGPKAPIFYVPVYSIVQAKLVLLALAQYDLFLEKNKLMGDWGNAGGLEMREHIPPLNPGEWEEWTTKDGDHIDELEWDVIKDGELRGRI